MRRAGNSDLWLDLGSKGPFRELVQTWPKLTQECLHPTAMLTWESSLSSKIVSFGVDLGSKGPENSHKLVTNGLQVLAGPYHI